MSNNRKARVAALLRKGYSYNWIHQKLGVSKSTINSWFREFSEKDKENIKKYRLKNWQKSYSKYAEFKKRKTLKNEETIQENASQDIKDISKRELLLIGTALYWGEGCKKNRWGLQFSNSDPEVISLIMKFFRYVCRVPENKFYMQMILHNNISGRKALDFWAKITKVKRSQFKKSCFSLSRSSKKIRRRNQLPYGTLQVRIHNKELTHRVYGYIKGLKHAGVVQR